MGNRIKLSVLVPLVAVGLLLSLDHAQGTNCSQHRGATILNGGYEDVRILIDPSLPEDPSLRDKIQQLFTSASTTLYRAIDGLAYFRSIKVIIPTSWTNFTIDDDATLEDLDSRRADFQLLPDSTPIVNDNRPTVVKSSLICGQEGDFVALNSKFLKMGEENESTGTRAKQLVQSWAEYRYGVFPEYFDEKMNADAFSNFPFDVRYCSSNHDPSPTVCPAVDVRQGDYINANGHYCHPCQSFQFNMSSGNSAVSAPPCKFFRVRKFPLGTTTSLMYTTAESKILHFCTEENHNPFAPNMHNVKCGRRSVMFVIKNDTDFNTACGAPKKTLDVSSNKTPKFTFVKASSNLSTIVFVLDTSDSMKGKDGGRTSRIDVLKQAYAAAIECMAEGTSVAVVEFANKQVGSPKATTIFNLTKITQSNRHDLQNNVTERLNHGGSTPLGSGILQGLNEVGHLPRGSKMIIVSDGEESAWEHPQSDSPAVVDVLKAANVSVDTIAYSAVSAHKLTKLASDFGGKAYFLNTQAGNSDVNVREVISQLCQLSANGDDSALSAQLLSEVAVLNHGSYVGSIYIDEFCGKNTLFLFTKQSTAQMVYVERGLWTYNLSTPISTSTDQVHGGRNRRQIENETINILVKSDAPSAEKALSLSTWYSNPKITSIKTEPLILFARVSQGVYPVLNASVKTTILAPPGFMSAVLLLDDGKGADAVANDGTYSALFTQFHGTGRYTASTVLTDNNKGAFTNRRLTQAKNGTGSQYLTTSLGQLSPRIIANDLFDVGDRFANSCLTSPTINDNPCIPPGAITDLKVELVSFNKKTFAFYWTAPGSDYNKGKAAFYKLAISNDPWQLLHNFSDVALTVPRILSWPAEAGTSQEIHIPLASMNLPKRSKIFLALQAIDKHGNAGPAPPQANIAEVEFSPRDEIVVDNIPPGRITDLQASHDAGAAKVTLTWTATGNDDQDGTATAYNVIFATDCNLDNATIITNNSVARKRFLVDGSLQPKKSGLKESVVIQLQASDLLAGERSKAVFFAVRVFDASPKHNKGTQSNIVAIEIHAAGTDQNGGSDLWLKIGLGVMGGVIVALVVVVAILASQRVRSRQKASVAATYGSGAGENRPGVEMRIY